MKQGVYSTACSSKLYPEKKYFNVLTALPACSKNEVATLLNAVQKLMTTAGRGPTSLPAPSAKDQTLQKYIFPGGQ